MTDVKEDLRRLEAAIAPHGSMLVAFSGGVDSAVLLAAAVRALGRGVIALTADSPSMARRELLEAREVAARLGVEHRIINTSETDRPEYRVNDRGRCFFCKQTLFEDAWTVARDLGFAAVSYGYTADDTGDYRPGHAAAQRYGILAPLADAGLGKAKIRAIARALELKVWDKPAAPCLSSRIPYGSEVTTEKLAIIEHVEDWLHAEGFRVNRARFDGALMRIEVELDEIERLEAMRERLEGVVFMEGVQRLEIDPEGFLSGKLNRIGPVDGPATAR